MKKQINNSKLIAYSAAAGAALAIAPNTFADVIYQNVNILFGDGQGGRKNLTMEGTHSEFWFDGNGSYSLFNCGTNNNDGAFNVEVVPFIKAFSIGAYIGPATNTPNRFGGYFCSNTKGDWAANNDTNYCGVSFKLESDTNKTVYGWIQVIRLTTASGKIIAWGYEEDGTKINIGPIPEPVTGLTLLALGAAGIATYRKKSN